MSVKKWMRQFGDFTRQVKYKLKHDFLSFENVVLMLAVLLCAVWTYQSVAAMSRNWQLSETLTREKSQLELLSIEVETLDFENEYYRSAEYQELMARKLLDKQLPGENMVVMPENSQNAITKHQVVEEVVQQRELSNFEQWINYLFPQY